MADPTLPIYAQAYDRRPNLRPPVKHRGPPRGGQQAQGPGGGAPSGTPLGQETLQPEVVVEPVETVEPVVLPTRSTVTGAAPLPEGEPDEPSGTVARPGIEEVKSQQAAQVGDVPSTELKPIREQQLESAQEKEERTMLIAEAARQRVQRTKEDDALREAEAAKTAQFVEDYLEFSEREKPGYLESVIFGKDGFELEQYTPTDFGSQEYWLGENLDGKFHFVHGTPELHALAGEEYKTPSDGGVAGRASSLAFFIFTDMTGSYMVRRTMFSGGQKVANPLYETLYGGPNKPPLVKTADEASEALRIATQGVDDLADIGVAKITDTPPVTTPRAPYQAATPTTAAKPAAPTTAAASPVAPVWEATNKKLSELYDKAVLLHHRAEAVRAGRIGSDKYGTYDDLMAELTSIEAKLETTSSWMYLEAEKQLVRKGGAHPGWKSAYENKLDEIDAFLDRATVPATPTVATDDALTKLRAEYRSLEAEREKVGWVAGETGNPAQTQALRDIEEQLYKVAEEIDQVGTARGLTQNEIWKDAGMASPEGMLSLATRQERMEKALFAKPKEVKYLDDAEAELARKTELAELVEKDPNTFYELMRQKGLTRDEIHARFDDVLAAPGSARDAMTGLPVRPPSRSPIQEADDLIDRAKSKVDQLQDKLDRNRIRFDHLEHWPQMEARLNQELDDVLTTLMRLEDDRARYLLEEQGVTVLQPARQAETPRWKREDVVEGRTSQEGVRPTELTEFQLRKYRESGEGLLPPEQQAARDALEAEANRLWADPRNHWRTQIEDRTDEWSRAWAAADAANQPTIPKRAAGGRPVGPSEEVAESLSLRSKKGERVSANDPEFKNRPYEERAATTRDEDQLFKLSYYLRWEKVMATQGRRARDVYVNSTKTRTLEDAIENLHRSLEPGGFARATAESAERRAAEEVREAAKVKTFRNEQTIQDELAPLYKRLKHWSGKIPMSRWGERKFVKGQVARLDMQIGNLEAELATMRQRSTPPTGQTIGTIPASKYTGPVETTVIIKEGPPGSWQVIEVAPNGSEFVIDNLLLGTERKARFSAQAHVDLSTASSKADWLDKITKRIENAQADLELAEMQLNWGNAGDPVFVARVKQARADVKDWQAQYRRIAEDMPD